MIKEFALEPEVISSSYEDFRYFTEKFGIPQGRVISRFPKAWKRMVYEAAQEKLKGTTALSRIEVKLDALGEDVIFSSGRPGGDSTKSWLDRALVEQIREPFSGIISVNPNANPAVVASAILDGEHPHFSPNNQWEIQRSSDMMVECANVLLKNCKIVKLVDPHFDPSTRRFRRTFEKVIARLSCRQVLVEVYRSDRIPNNLLLQRFNQLLPAILPSGVTLKLYVLPEEPEHNRFIMTENGGLIYCVGLDDNEDGGGSPTDQVSLMTPKVLKSRWEYYSNCSAIGEWSSS